MARVACLLADGFEDREFHEVAAALAGAGHRVAVVGPRIGARIAGLARAECATVDGSLDDLRPEDVDALFLPGGFSPRRLTADPRAVRLVADVAAAGKPILAIGEGPRLLLAARHVQGRTLTAAPDLQESLRGEPGVHVLDLPVVRDRGLLTSRGPADLPAFIGTALDLLEEERRPPPPELPAGGVL